jgi:hypothetical protein
MVHQDRGLYDPRISVLRLRIPTFLGAIDRAFFLSLADEHYAFPLLELFALLFGKVVFALPFSKGIRGIWLSLAKRSIEATNSRVMGSTIRVEATGVRDGYE